MIARTEITSIDQLREIYDQPKPAPAHKVIDHIDEHVASFIAGSPFVLMSTVSADGRMDVSPKGETPGFIKILDSKTLIFPDRPGNNRIDGLQNIVETGRIGLIFLVPGVRETLRINGSAIVSIDPDLMSKLEIDGKQPRTVTVITVEEVFMHCSRAVIRSNLWDPAAQVERSQLPSMGTILAAHTNGIVDQCDYDENLPTRVKENLY